MKKLTNESKTVAVATLGCKVNQCESASFQTSFEEQGFTLTSPELPADIYVINTCAVTAKAAAQSRQLIRRVLRTNPGAKVVVTGCYAQVAPEKILKISPVSTTIVGNADKHRVVEAAVSGNTAERFMGQKTESSFFHNISLQKEISQLPVRSFSGRTRAFLKVQDGCNNFCTYCIVPYARGRSRSLAPEKVLAQAHTYASEDHKEIVLTGIHAGNYGLDLEESINLYELLRKLCRATPGVRYRLSSLEPTEISPELLNFMSQTDNFMPHLHIPLQSGSDRILKKMNRRYTADQFIEKVKNCKEMMPAAAIGVDVLVGFPDETEEDFLQTFELVAQLPITYLHVFPYSTRPGTPAAEMDHQIPAKIKEERVAILRKLDHKKRKAFYESRVNKIHPVLVEAEKTADGLAKGFTDNYIPVQFKATPADDNRVVQVKLEQLRDRFVFGILV